MISGNLSKYSVSCIKTHMKTIFLTLFVGFDDGEVDITVRLCFGDGFDLSDIGIVVDGFGGIHSFCVIHQDALRVPHVQSSTPRHFNLN